MSTEKLTDHADPVDALSLAQLPCGPEHTANMRHVLREATDLVAFSHIVQVNPSERLLGRAGHLIDAVRITEAALDPSTVARRMIVETDYWFARDMPTSANHSMDALDRMLVEGVFGGNMAEANLLRAVVDFNTARMITWRYPHQNTYGLELFAAARLRTQMIMASDDPNISAAASRLNSLAAQMQVEAAIRLGRPVLAAEMIGLCSPLDSGIRWIDFDLAERKKAAEVLIALAADERAAEAEQVDAKKRAATRNADNTQAQSLALATLRRSLPPVSSLILSSNEAPVHTTIESATTAANQPVRRRPLRPEPAPESPAA